jgi:hypothetical protein
MHVIYLIRPKHTVEETVIIHDKAAHHQCTNTTAKAAPLSETISKCSGLLKYNVCLMS